MNHMHPLAAPCPAEEPVLIGCDESVFRQLARERAVIPANAELVPLETGMFPDHASDLLQRVF